MTYYLAPEQDNGHGYKWFGSWICNPRCNSRNEEPEATLIARRLEVEVIGEVSDAEADYSFNDYALVRLDGKYYLLNTSGCSCPSPDEEWGVVMGPSSLDEIEAHLIDASGEKGYGVTKRQHQEFMDLVAEARKGT